MKQYFVKTAAVASMLALMTTGSFAQDDKKESATTTVTHNNNDDVIIIKPKVDVNTKLTIEIKGDDVTVNGKPLSEYKSDDIIISKRKQFSAKREVEEWENAPGTPRTRFRGGANVYSFGGPDDNLAMLNGRLSSTNSNKAFLGVGSEKSADGVTITSVSDGSGADKAGLQEGDIITKINETKISSPDDLTKTIGKFNPEDKITVTYKRDKKEQKTTAVLSKRKISTAMSYASPKAYEFKKFNFDNGDSYSFSFNGKAKLGLKAQETEDGKGLKVLDVDDESTAEKAGIKEGDIITSFDGTEVNNIDKLRELSAPAMEKGNFKVKLIRDGKAQEVDVKIPKKLKSTSL